MRTLRLSLGVALVTGAAVFAQGRGGGGAPQTPPLELPADTPRMTALKTEAAAEVEKLKDFSQQMVDQIFSYGELGFQEFETSKYLVDAAEASTASPSKTGVAGIPTAFMATWGSGKPVIALGSDIDGIPQSSQKPGVAYRDPMVDGAPGHGEGHNSGQAVNITAAIVLKKIMEREKIPGTIRIWPGVAEELVGTKAYFIRAGPLQGRGRRALHPRRAAISRCPGATAAARAWSPCSTASRARARTRPARPWRGRSALDAVELMNVGWNYRREHLPLSHRSHYVIDDGGDQPNVVPPTASVWYYFRQVTYPGIKEMWATGDKIARRRGDDDRHRRCSRRASSARPGRGTSTARSRRSRTRTSRRSACPSGAKPTRRSRAPCRRSSACNEQGLSTRVGNLGGPVDQATNTGGGSDDIGDISWNVPTVTLSLSVEHPGLPGHNWVERHRDGDARRAQGRDRRRQGAGDDARRPRC